MFKQGLRVRAIVPAAARHGAARGPLQINAFAPFWLLDAKSGGVHLDTSTTVKVNLLFFRFAWIIAGFSLNQTLFLILNH